LGLKMSPSNELTMRLAWAKRCELGQLALHQEPVQDAPDTFAN
jgi:hypothetical protein